MTDQNHVFIIAEAGVNHNGELTLAEQLVDAAAAAGADAVKFQTFNADRLAGLDAGLASYQADNMGQQITQRDMLAALELKEEWHQPLKERAQAQGIEFLSTAFDLQSLAFLQQLDLSRFKVPSGELTNAPLLWAFATAGKPLILSTGMADMDEITFALAIVHHALTHEKPPQDNAALWASWPGAAQAAQNVLGGRISLLHCTSDYPAAPETVNLRAMDQMADAFGLPVGYSDHTAGIGVSLAAVARGATIIEKHFTLDRELEGPDHKASLTVPELAEMVAGIRAVNVALGDGIKRPQAVELATRELVRQRIIAVKDLPAGHVLTAEDVRTARGAAGLFAADYWDCIGGRLTADVRAGMPVLSIQREGTEKG